MHTATTGYAGVFPGRPDQVSRARHEVTRYLGDGHPAAEAAALVVSELAANAVLHSRSRHGLFTVRAQTSPGCLRVEVADAGGPWEPGGDRDGGRGLVIVAVLAAGCGVDGDAGGRTAWATITW